MSRARPLPVAADLGALRALSLREMARQVEAFGLEAIHEELTRRRREYGPASLSDSDWRPPVGQPPSLTATEEH